MSGFTASSNTTVCTCSAQRLYYHGCLCGAEMQRLRQKGREAVSLETARFKAWDYANLDEGTVAASADADIRFSGNLSPGLS
jgi:hypothetical protein